jgi:hypothetical protein
MGKAKQLRRAKRLALAGVDLNGTGQSGLDEADAMVFVQQTMESHQADWAGQLGVDKAIAFIQQNICSWAGKREALFVHLSNTTHKASGQEVQHGYTRWQIQEIKSWLEANLHWFDAFSEAAVCLIRVDGTEIIARISSRQLPSPMSPRSLQSPSFGYGGVGRAPLSF